MRTLYIDTDENLLISDPSFKTVLNSLSFKRGDDGKLGINLVSGNTSLSAVSGVNVIFGVKKVGDYDGSYVVAASAYGYSGNSYLLYPSFNTVPLNTLLGSDSLTGNDVGSVTLMGELTWSTDNVTWQSTNQFAVTVQNDVIKTPTSFPVEYASSSFVSLSTSPTTGSLSAKTQNVSIATPSPTDDTYYTLTINASTANYAMGYSLSGNDIYIDHGVKASMKCDLFPEIPLFYAGLNYSGSHEWTDLGILFDDYALPLTDYIYLDSQDGTNCAFARMSAGVLVNEAATTTTTEWPDGQTYTATTGATPSFSAIPITSSALANIIYVNLVGSTTSAYFGTLPWYAPQTYVDPTPAVNLVTVGTAGILNQDAIVSKSDVYKCVRIAPYYKWAKLT